MEGEELAVVQCNLPHLQKLISQDDGDHALHHGHGPRHNAGVVAASRPQLCLDTLSGHRLLLDTDRGGRLERHPDDNVLAVGDAALDAAGPVGQGPHLWAAVGGREM